ncbi:MAG TPA: cytochrome c3 family protein [Rhodocyclaceae bacterium]
MTRKYRSSKVAGLAAALLLALGAGTALAQTATAPDAALSPSATAGTFTPDPFTPTASIAGTKHNLGSNGTGPNNFTGTTEICVFCHTPHGSDSSAAVPLWNRALNHGQTYNTYDQLGTSTLNGAVKPVGSVSLACLSCHDGTQAMNLMINQPGSGWGNTTALTNGAGPANAQLFGSIQNGADNLSSDPTDIVWIGTDLRNDHPVGVEYCGGGLTATAGSNGAANVTGTCNNPDFKAPKAKIINGNTVFWVDTSVGTTNVREKTDIQLYTRDFTGLNNSAGQGGANEPSVECASCHDPHNGQNPTFLRVSNDNSGVCLSCHVK